MRAVISKFLDILVYRFRHPVLTLEVFRRPLLRLADIGVAICGRCAPVSIALSLGILGVAHALLVVLVGVALALLRWIIWRYAVESARIEAHDAL